MKLAKLIILSALTFSVNFLPLPAIASQTASWYGRETCRANGTTYGSSCRTANGEVFNENALVAAHCSYPFGTQVRVTNRANGRSVVVRITDRGGFCGMGRAIDLSYGAMRALGGITSGIINVTIQRLN